MCVMLRSVAEKYFMRQQNEWTTEWSKCVVDSINYMDFINATAHTSDVCVCVCVRAHDQLKHTKSSSLARLEYSIRTIRIPVKGLDASGDLRARFISRFQISLLSLCIYTIYVCIAYYIYIYIYMHPYLLQLSIYTHIYVDQTAYIRGKWNGQ